MQPPRRLRPIFCFVAAFAAGILVGPALPLPPLFLAVMAATLLIWSLCQSRQHGLLALAAASLAFLLLGAASEQRATAISPADIVRLAGGPSVWVEGTVASETTAYPSGARGFTLAAHAADDFQSIRPADGEVSVLLTQTEGMALRPGDAVWLRGRIALPDDVRNPGGFDDRAFLARRGVHSVLVVRRPEDVRATEAGGEAAPIARLADALRRSVLRAIVAHMGADDAGLLSGILFSVRAGLPADLQDALSRTGALYILSVSGLELSALAGVVVLILTRTGVPRRAAGAGAACIVWLFVLAAGGASGSERAAILLTVLLLAPLLRRTAEQINSLAVAALLILAREPLALYDSGFQLSFATLAVLLLYAPALERLWLPFEPGQSRRERAGRGILSALLAGAVAHVGSLPLVACYFNQLSFIAPLATVLIAPLSVGVLLAGLATVMLSALVPAALAAPLWALLAAGLHLLRTLVFTLAAVPCAAVSVASPPPLLLITYYALLLIAAPFLRRWALRKALFRPRSGKP